MFKNRGDCNKVHRELAPGRPCNVVSKEEADKIFTPRRATRGRTTTPAANRESATSNHFPLTPPSTSLIPAASSTVSTRADQAATPTPAPVGSRFGLSPLGSYTSQPTRETAAEPKPEDNFDIGDDILVSVRRSTSVYSNEAGSRIDRPSSTSDAGMVDNIAAPTRQPIVSGRQPSSASTVLVPETPFPLPPALDEAGPSNHHDPPQRHDSAGPEEIAFPTPHMAQHMIELEIMHLRRSQAQYVEELEESTGLVNRLRTRQQIHEIDAVLTQNRLDQLEADRRTAREQAIEAERQGVRTTSRLLLILVFLVIIVLAYGWWCAYLSPEMEYIMKRREEVLQK